ncbi:MAG: hypothetical protein ACJATN_000997 [Neolewinella sp.]|jgi:hypothetical protein
MLRKHLILSALLTVGLGLTTFSCGSDSDTVEVPTEGLVTTVKEVSTGDFKIESEVPVSNIADSRVIVEDLGGNRDTFTLDEAKMVSQVADPDSRAGRPFRSAGMGYFGFLMLSRMGRTPSAGAYINNGAHQSATSNAGSSMRNSARSTTRSKSGFGGGKSTRSFGG